MSDSMMGDRIGFAAAETLLELALDLPTTNIRYDYVIRGSSNGFSLTKYPDSQYSDTAV